MLNPLCTQGERGRADNAMNCLEADKNNTLSQIENGFEDIHWGCATENLKSLEPVVRPKVKK